MGEGVSVSISASSEKLTVEAKSATSAEGAKVTITATATMPVGSSFIPEQTVSDVASYHVPCDGGRHAAVGRW